MGMQQGAKVESLAGSAGRPDHLEVGFGRLAGEVRASRTCRGYRRR